MAIFRRFIRTGAIIDPVLKQYIALLAGIFPVALPLQSVRQILDMGGDTSLEPHAIGVMPISLAALLGHRESATVPALLLFDGAKDPLVLSACQLFGIFATDEIVPLPSAVPQHWAGLVPGIVRGSPAGAGHHQSGDFLVLDLSVLLGIVEAAP